LRPAQSTDKFGRRKVMNSSSYTKRGPTRPQEEIARIELESLDTKFFAWADPFPGNSYGIPLQWFKVDTKQVRQYIGFNYNDQPCLGKIVHVSSDGAPDSTWKPENILDADPFSAWTSLPHSTPDAEEWFAFWFDRQAINCLELTPRTMDGKAYNFPEVVDIYRSAGPGLWKHVKTVHFNLDHVRNKQPKVPGQRPAPILVSLDGVIVTDGLWVVASRLTKDEGQSYYFQMAGARALHRTIPIDFVQTATAAATQFPQSLFFFGDEPDQNLPADEYAIAYKAFVDAIRAGSPQAKVSPAGFAQRNPEMYGDHYTEYADRLHDAYATLFHTTIPADEWRFHNFYYPSLDAVSLWKAEIDQAATWSIGHNAPMVLGSFGSPGYPEPNPQKVDAEVEALKYIKADSRIIAAVWWRYNKPINSQDTFTLVSESNALTDCGIAFEQYLS
jgi:hypothetical protein